MGRSYAFALLLALPSLTFARSYPIAAEVQRLHAAGAEQPVITVLKAVEAPADAPFRKALRDGTMADIDQTQLGTVLQEKPGFIRILLPFRGDALTLDLYRVDPLADGFTVRTDKGPFQGYTPGVYYRGIIAGDPTSVAGFSFFRDQVIGMASSSALGNVVVERMLGRSHDRHIIYSDRDLIAPHGLICGTADVRGLGDDVQPHADVTGHDRTEKCVRLYYEVSYGAFQLNDSDAVQSVDWMTAGHNIVATLFANDGITVSLSEVFVWTEPEAFHLNGDQYDVGLYADYRTAFNGDVANYINTSNGSGFARGIGGICGSGDPGASPHEISPVLYTDDLWSFEWMAPMITHEIGHVCGSQHTHACVWNDNSTQIDDCGNANPAFGIVEGAACYDSAHAILPIGHGTIMSYCGVDLSLGFGPQPGQRIRDHVNAATCLGGDCIHSCTPSLDSIAIIDITPHSAVLTFHEIDPSITSWHVQVLDDSQIMIDWTTITSVNYPLNGLSPGHYYEVHLRSACPEPWSTNVVYIRSFVPPETTCGQHVYDIGGNGVPYPGYSTVNTYYPDVAGNKVTFHVNTFSIEPGQDFVTIYNGADTDAPSLGTFTGTTIPSTFTSTDPSGALTIALAVDGEEFNAYEGWDITLSCAPGITAGIDDPSLDPTGFAYYPNPANDRLTVEYTTRTAERVALELYDMQGRLVQTLMPPATQAAGAHHTTFPLDPLASGCYSLRLSIGEESHAFKLLK